MKHTFITHRRYITNSAQSLIRKVQLAWPFMNTNNLKLVAKCFGINRHFVILFRKINYTQNSDWSMFI